LARRALKGMRGGRREGMPNQHNARTHLPKQTNFKADLARTYASWLVRREQLGEVL
jgi:hypothetical protein